MCHPILVSACLAGKACRYDGTDCADPYILKLVEEQKTIMVCPEQLADLPIPRPPIEIRNNQLIDINGVDHSIQYMKGARKALQIALENKVKCAYLKANSPTCGCGMIYDGSFSKKLIIGNGIFTQLLIEKQIKVKSSN